MTGEPIENDHLLAQLREQASRLVAEVDGPLRRIRMRSGNAVVEIEWHGATTPVDAGPVLPTDTVGRPVSAVSGTPAAAGSSAGAGSRDWVVAPMVGTFYRAAEPGAAPFVEVGDLVEPGQVIGIVEAMKLMNHITAEHAGKVAEVLVGNGDPVEFDQPLIALVSA
ncbi:acetyl-CoA carboxylase biotin carboxyl carrier protein [Micromonospora sp. NPDC050417]|uniref:acetyl-CoA carboxylase biotin carboxyl carrier protein n=1 Tax=Micromonospora sp. NPDC050417 TaxID=3364280 RepID=UPI0037919B5C